MVSQRQSESYELNSAHHAVFHARVSPSPHPDNIFEGGQVWVKNFRSHLRQSHCYLNVLFGRFRRFYSVLDVFALVWSSASAFGANVKIWPFLPWFWSKIVQFGTRHSSEITGFYRERGLPKNFYGCCEVPRPPLPQPLPQEKFGGMP